MLWVTWLVKLHAAEKFGDEFARNVMAAVYGRLAANEDRVPEIENVGEGIKYWFKEMEAGAVDEAENPTVVAGHQIPIYYFIGLRFLYRDSGSPFCGNPNPVFNDVDVAVGTALEEAQNLSRPRIEYTMEKASMMPR